MAEKKKTQKVKKTAKSTKKKTSSKKSTKSTKKSASKKATPKKKVVVKKTPAPKEPSKETESEQAKIIEATQVPDSTRQPNTSKGVSIEVKHWLDEDTPTEEKKTSKVIETPATKIEISSPPDEAEPEPEIELPQPADTEVEDGHEWHKFDVEGDESERPEWDEESYAETDEQAAEVEAVPDKTDEEIVNELVGQNLNSEDELEEERPEWDQEAYAEADDQTEVVESTRAEVTDKTDLDEVEEPEWDKEKWQHAAVEELQEDSDRPEWDDEKYKNPKKTGIASLLNKVGSRIKAWWKNPKQRNLTLAGAGTFLVLLMFIPTTRYTLLNTAGVRATASVSIVDSETKLPLKNVTVELADKKSTTNSEGYVVFDGIKYGNHQIAVRKTAFQEHTASVVIGSGNTDMGEIPLVSIGARFNFRITDWLTDQALVRAEVSYGDNSAFTDETGLAVLTVPTDSPTTITAEATAAGYQGYSVEFTTTSTNENNVNMVIDRTHYFVSKRDGTYDIYASDADGSDQRLVLAGTGDENPDMRFDVSSDGSQAVLISTRDKSITNDSGFVLSGIYDVDLNSGKLEKVDESERIDIIGWIDNTVVYVKIQAGASGRNPKRHRLVTYNFETKTNTELFASNYFNDVLVAGDYVFYAPSDAYKQDPKAFLYRSSADGTSVRTVLARNVWTVLRTGYDDIVFDSQQTWYSGMINEIRNTELSSRPSDVASRLYSDNQNGDKSAWVDTRDGKGTLIITDIDTGEETTLWAQGGLRNPIVWLSDNHIVFRVVSDTETADYVIGLDGGEPRKISDVTNVSGADRWYYYY